MNFQYMPELTTRYGYFVVVGVIGLICALLYRQYNFFMRWVMKRIAAKAGGDTDTSRDYEYTDWNDVRAFAGQFGRMVTVASARVVLAAAG